MFNQYINYNKQDEMIDYKFFIFIIIKKHTKILLTKLTLIFIQSKNLYNNYI